MGRSEVGPGINDQLFIRCKAWEYGPGILAWALGFGWSKGIDCV
jgi:hypothetical protein